MPGAKLGLIECSSRLPNQKANSVSAYDEEIFVAKLELIFASANWLK